MESGILFFLLIEYFERILFLYASKFEKIQFIQFKTKLIEKLFFFLIEILKCLMVDSQKLNRNLSSIQFQVEDLFKIHSILLYKKIAILLQKIFSCDFWETAEALGA